MRGGRHRAATTTAISTSSRPESAAASVAEVIEPRRNHFRETVRALARFARYAIENNGIGIDACAVPSIGTGCKRSDNWQRPTAAGGRRRRRRQCGSHARLAVAAAAAIAAVAAAAAAVEHHFILSLLKF